MPEQEIVCPYCGKKIALTEALIHPIEERLQRKYEKEIKKMERVLEQRENELVKVRKDTEKRMKEKLMKERLKIEKEAKKKAEEDLSFELRDLRCQLQEKSKKLVEAENRELELRKQQRELEEKERALKLEITRKVDEERKKIMEDVSNKMKEEYQLKEAEYKKQVSDLNKQIEELKRKAEQTSAQLTGEVLELKLEEILKENFPSDSIEPVPKGISGADILQKVYDLSGCCGTIVWESKRTKNWRDDWIQKLKNDQREIKADIGVLVTTALPKEVSNFDYIDGIVVTTYPLVVPIATLLRTQLIEVRRIKRSTVGRDEKIEILYNYLTSPEFRQKVETIAEAFVNMKKDLDQEKRAMERIWAKREKQILRAVYGVAGMYGDMQGILGASLPELKSLNALELPSGTDTNETDENTEQKG